MEVLNLGNLSAEPCRTPQKQPSAWTLPVMGGAVFAGVVCLLLWMLPGPRPDLDYLVTGVVAMLVALLAMFLAQIKMSKDVFFRRKGQ